MTKTILETLRDSGWITTLEAVELTGYTQRHLRRLAADGKITAQRVGRTLLYDRENLLQWQRTARSKPRRRRTGPLVDPPGSTK